jgi:hypothetical protein
MQPTFYIASRLENAPQVRELRDLLIAAGWRITYDWTAHGSVRGGEADRQRIREVAAAERNGVIDADVFIGLLPGGRGMHVELGIALACVSGLATFGGLKSPSPVVIWSPDFERDFGVTEATSAFYHDPLVTRVNAQSMRDLADFLIDHYSSEEG